LKLALGLIHLNRTREPVNEHEFCHVFYAYKTSRGLFTIGEGMNAGDVAINMMATLCYLVIEFPGSFFCTYLRVLF
jgi:hypothetical protein